MSRLKNSAAAKALDAPANEMEGRILTARLVYSLEAGLASRVEGALAEGADPNGVSEEGKPMLIIAANFLRHSGKERLKCLKLLLKAGANANARNNQGVSALASCAHGGANDLEMREKATKAAKALLSAGADPLAVCSNGWSALHRAAESGNNPLVVLLIKAGARVEQGNAYKETPLMLAALYDSEPCVLTLLSCGADPMAIDCDGQTALESCLARYGKDAASHAALRSAMEAAELKEALGAGSQKPSARL